MDEKKAEVAAQFTRLHALLTRHQKQRFASGGVSGTPHIGQGRVLSLLRAQPEITQRELTARLGMTKQAVAQLLGKLEKGDYITREVSAQDRRVSRIRLTQAGIALADEIDIVPHERGAELDCLNAGELATLSEYLGRIIRRFEALSAHGNDKGAGK